jgi:hypothetical protein
MKLLTKLTTSVAAVAGFVVVLVTPASAGLLDGEGVDIGPIHVDPTNPVAPVTPKDAHVPNPAAPIPSLGPLPVPVTPIPLPAPIQAAVDKLGRDATRTVEQLGYEELRACSPNFSEH